MRKLLQHAQARAVVAFGKYDVEADDGDLVVVEQLVEQERQAVARPRPAAFAAFFLLGEAFFIDVENDDARIYRARHRQRQPRVVNDGLQTLDQRQPVILRRVPEKHEQQDHAQADANHVVFSNRLLCRRPLHATNAAAEHQ